MKKLPHNIDTEELLKALETAEDIQELVSFKNDVPLFLSKFKIEAGSNFILPRMLYKLYKLYSVDPVSQQVFSLSCSEFVPRKGHYFKLNITPLKVTKILTKPKNRNDISSSHFKKHYDKFIETANITKGTKWTEGFMLFEVYRFYCIDHKLHKRLTYENFVTISKMYFEHKRIGSSKGMWFKMDHDTLSILTPEHQQNVRNSRRMNDKEREKRKPKKGSGSKPN